MRRRSLTVKEVSNSSALTVRTPGVEDHGLIATRLSPRVLAINCLEETASSDQTSPQNTAAASLD